MRQSSGQPGSTTGDPLAVCRLPKAHQRRKSLFRPEGGRPRTSSRTRRSRHFRLPDNVLRLLLPTRATSTRARRWRHRRDQGRHNHTTSIFTGEKSSGSTGLPGGDKNDHHDPGVTKLPSLAPKRQVDHVHRQDRSSVLHQVFSGAGLTLDGRTRPRSHLQARLHHPTSPTEFLRTRRLGLGGHCGASIPRSRRSTAPICRAGRSPRHNVPRNTDAILHRLRALNWRRCST